MATVDQWRWPIQIQGGGSASYHNRVRQSQFGDGIKQFVPEGFHPEFITIPISYTGITKDALQVRDFLRAHVGVAFSIAPPNLPLGLYVVQIDSISDTPSSRNTMTVTATIEQSYGIY